MKRVAIINKPLWERCGAGRTRRWLTMLERTVGAEVFFTDRPGHAGELARASADAGLIIASGGDGTMHEIVNAMDLDRQALAIIPIGTGNGLCRDLAVGPVERSLRAAAEGKVRRIDLLKYRLVREAGVEACYGVSTAGLGFICDVVSFANRHTKSCGGLSYPVAAFAAVWRGKGIRATAEVDGRDIGMNEFTNLVINNGQYAGNFCIFPSARPDDAAIHILAAKIHPFAQCLYSITILTRTYCMDAGIRTKASSLRIVAEKDPFSLMIDGEIYPAVREVGCEILPRRLAVAG